MPEDLRPAVVLGDRYRLGERIGRGGMADVHRAVDLRLRRDVAVKVFRRDVAEAVDPRRIARESRFLAGGRHPALVSVLDVSGPDSPTAYLVMELVPGADLGERLRLGAIDPDHARRIVADVADALAVLHARKLVHRDVKPANILVLDRGSDAEVGVAAKLADLGIAVGLDETRLTATDAILGTAAYLSPEQVQGLAVGPSSDVYALGLVLIECLTGERAYAGGLVESAVARVHRPPALPADASPALATLLARMTALDPGARPRAAEVAAILASLRGAMTVPEIPVTAPLARAARADDVPTTELEAAHPVGRRRRRSRVSAVVAAAAVGIVLVSGAALLPQLHARQPGSIAAPAAHHPSTGPTATPTTAPAPAVGTAAVRSRSETTERVALVSTTTARHRTPNAAARPSRPVPRAHPEPRRRDAVTVRTPPGAPRAPGAPVPHGPPHPPNGPPQHR